MQPPRESTREPKPQVSLLIGWIGETQASLSTMRFCTQTAWVWILALLWPCNFVQVTSAVWALSLHICKAGITRMACLLGHCRIRWAIGYTNHLETTVHMVNTQEDLLLFEMNLDTCQAPTSGLSCKQSTFLLEPPGPKITKTVCALKACSIPGPSGLALSH